VQHPSAAARIVDRHIIVMTGLASISVAMPEQIEKSHSSPVQPSYTAQPHVVLSERRSSARGSSDLLRAGDTRLVKWQASADRTQGPLVGKHLFPEHREIPSVPLPAQTKLNTR
jgi:hypothetical protein